MILLDKLKKDPVIKRFTFKDKEKFLSYLLAVYEFNSPLNKKYPDLDERKDAACEEVGWDFKTKAVLDILLLRNKATTNIINHFLCRIQSKNKYELWISNQELFSNFNRLMREPNIYIYTEIEVGDDPEQEKLKKIQPQLLDPMKLIDFKAKLSEELDKIQGRIDTYQEAIYRNWYGEKEIGQVQMLKIITPESQADQG